MSLDWSVANTIWQKKDQNYSSIEATTTEGCRRIKQRSPGTRCFMYFFREYM